MMDFLVLLTLFNFSTLIASYGVDSNDVKYNFRGASKKDDVMQKRLMASDRKMLQRNTLIALDKVITYFEKYNKRLNVDGLAGLMYANEVMKRSLQKRYSFLSSSSKELLRYLSFESYRLETIIQKAKMRYQMENNRYWQKLKVVCEAFSKFKASKQQQFKKSLVWKHKLSFSDKLEIFNDDCLSKMTGTRKVPGTTKKVPRCTITDSCWKGIMRRQSKGYLLTHQALDVIVLLSLNCRSEIKERIMPFSIDDLLLLFGSNILAEMEKVQTGNDVFNRFDLFLEQTFVCKSLGMKSCLRHYWLKIILEQQSKYGCVAYDDKLPEDTFQRLENDLDDDVEIPGKCSSHSTGLFVANLALYVNAFLEIENR